MNTLHENLASAIILQGVKDYRKVLSRYYLHPEKDSYRQEKDNLEGFFRSGWFAMLTSIDPEMLISRLNKEAMV